MLTAIFHLLRKIITFSGNVKTSIENFGSNVSSNGNTQLKVTPYSSTGVELNPTEPTDIQSTELIIVLRLVLLALTNPPYLDKSANAIRNQVQSGTVTTVSTVTGVTTVATVTNLTNFGSMSADVSLRILTMNAWSSNVRSLIT